MRLDYQNVYCWQQAVTATAYASDFGSVAYKDHGQARNLGVGERDLHLVVVVTTAFTDSGSDSTVTASLETDDNTSFSSATTTHTFTVFSALTAAGTMRKLKLGPDHINEQYSRVKFTLANGNLTTGALSAFICAEIDAFTAYADNVTIS